MSENRNHRRMQPAAAIIADRVATRVRERRLELGVSQQALAGPLGVRWQMIQKYECGLCRISAGTLGVLARELGVEPGYFFIEEGAAAAPVAPRMGLALMRNFQAIKNPKVRECLGRAIAALAGSEEA